MQLRDLEFLTTLIRIGSLTETAQLMHTTQSNASKILKKLEERFGFDIVERANGRLIPTQEGRIIAERAESALIGMRQVDSQARSLREMRHGNLIIGSTPQLSRNFAPKIAAQLMHSHPEITISIEARNSRALIELITQRQLDFAIGLLPSEDPNIDCQPLFEVQMIAALPVNHELAKKTSITARDFHGQNFITSSMLDRSREQIDAFFSAENASPIERGEASLSFARMQLVQQGIGLTLVNSLSTQEYFGSDLVFRPLSPEIKMTVWLIKSRLAMKSQIGDLFESAVKSYTASHGVVKPMKNDHN